MKIVWSPTARKSFDYLIESLESRWEKKVITKLFSEVERNLNLISKNPYLCPVISPRKGIRKCVVRRKTLMFYKVDESKNKIRVVLFVDGRWNPLLYKFA